jgi:hypothetical protein
MLFVIFTKCYIKPCFRSDLPINWINIRIEPLLKEADNYENSITLLFLYCCSHSPTVTLMHTIYDDSMHSAVNDYR